MIIKKYITIIKVSVTNAFIYRSNILSRFCFYTVFIYIFMNLWAMIYENGGVEGYSYNQPKKIANAPKRIAFTKICPK